LLTTFFGDRGGRRFAVARYSIVGGTVMHGGIVEADGSTDLSLLAQRMIDARQMALQLMAQPDHGLCSELMPNTLVLPPRAHGQLSVYVLTATVTEGIYPAGGHHRFDFDAQGQFVGKRRFMNSCYDFDFRTKENENRPVALGLSHLLDSQPTEIHAFVSRNVPLPLQILTVANGAVWEITEGRIRYANSLDERD
jgi:hypothetical protein